jgi:hypothetical protein
VKDAVDRVDAGRAERARIRNASADRFLALASNVSGRTRAQEVAADEVVARGAVEADLPPAGASAGDVQLAQATGETRRTLATEVVSGD